MRFCRGGRRRQLLQRDHAIESGSRICPNAHLAHILYGILQHGDERGERAERASGGTDGWPPHAVLLSRVVGGSLFVAFSRRSCHTAEGRESLTIAKQAFEKSCYRKAEINEAQTARARDTHTPQAAYHFGRCSQNVCKKFLHSLETQSR